MPGKVEILLYGVFRNRLGREVIPELYSLLMELEREGVPYGVVVDGRNVMVSLGLETPVSPGTRVKIFTYVSGGSLEAIWEAYRRYREDIRRAIKNQGHQVQILEEEVSVYSGGAEAIPREYPLRYTQW